MSKDKLENIIGTQASKLSDAKDRFVNNLTQFSACVSKALEEAGAPEDVINPLQSAMLSGVVDSKIIADSRSLYLLKGVEAGIKTHLMNAFETAADIDTRTRAGCLIGFETMVHSFANAIERAEHNDRPDPLRHIPILDR